MSNLSSLRLKTSYHKGQDDIARDFYLPCMERASAYDRAVGYFRSAVFTIAWPALRGFVNRGGRLRILCSQVLSAADIEALELGYSARADAEIAARLRDEVQLLLADPELREPARILAALVANGTLDFKVAILRGEDLGGARGRIFHDKVGLFSDGTHRVLFKGSMNETWSGLAADGNLESIDVAASWMGPRDLERTNTEERYFTDLWQNRYPTLLVRSFPQVAREELTAAAASDWEASLEKLTLAQPLLPRADAKGRSLRPHQSAGLAAWHANGRRGILAFATGSGKTFIALQAIRQSLMELRQPVLVLVPDQVLFHQWYKELAEATLEVGAKILRAGAGYDNWDGNVSAWTVADDSPRVLLATIQTAAKENFQAAISGGDHLLLVADEVHRLGSPRYRRILDNERYGARLGLSATPERYGDQEGTSAILGFFGGILEPRYSLNDAVRDGVLCRYFYRPHVVQLDEEETQNWRSITKEIGQIRARAGEIEQAEQRIQLLLIRRARIVKHAHGKIALAVEVLQSEFRRDQRWIVYCEDIGQLTDIVAALKAQGLQAIPFHSEMAGDRGQTLRWLERRGGVVVAIKCLDEGVDIPSVTHALILASSKNPREFIQRRGRVLRQAPGKVLAYIHDAIVLPSLDPTAEKEPDPITTGELARAVEFAKNATNPASAGDLEEIAVRTGIDWKLVWGAGSEDEEL